MSKGVLTVVSGFSGAGKGTVMKRLIQKYDDYALSISVTTRKPREGERDGIEYFFKTKEEVETMIENDEFLEYARYVDNYYGTPRFYVEEMLAKGKNVILEIEIQGALQVKKLYPEALLLFVMPPSADALKERLVGRGTETPDVIAQRLAISSKESQYMGGYDYLVINDQIEKSVENVHAIISCEHYKTTRNSDTIDMIQQDLKKFEGR